MARQPRTPGQILARLTSRPATVPAPAKAPPGTRQDPPRAGNRWLAASLTDTIQQVVTDAYTQADRRDPDHRKDWIALVDGNKSQIDAITAQATTRGITIPITQTRALLEGHPTQVVTEIRDRATRFRCTGTAKDKILAAATYLNNHLDHLDHPTALARGWPIATGVIEGACRNLVCDRLDVTGARWGLGPVPWI